MWGTKPWRAVGTSRTDFFDTWFLSRLFTCWLCGLVLAGWELELANIKGQILSHSAS